MGRARDIGKIIVFQGKRIDFRIIGILENLLFSTKNKQTIFRTKTNGKLHQICSTHSWRADSVRFARPTLAALRAVLLCTFLFFLSNAVGCLDQSLSAFRGPLADSLSVRFPYLFSLSLSVLFMLCQPRRAISLFVSEQDHREYTHFLWRIFSEI